MSENFGYFLRKASELNILEQIDLFEIENNIYKHRNIVFDIEHKYIPEIYIYDTEDIDLIKKNLKWKRTDDDIVILHVYGSEDIAEEFAEAPNYIHRWFMRGKWVDYIYKYFKNIEDIVTQIEKERAVAKMMNEERIKKEKKAALEQKVSRIESLFND